MPVSLYTPLRIYGPKRSLRFEPDRAAHIRQRVRGKSVLHVGCSNYPMTEQRLADNSLLHCALDEAARKIVGIDISPEGLELLRNHGFSNLILMDAEQLVLDDTFDIILAGDVLEHMNNPGNFLSRARDLLNPSGELIIGVPSALTANNIKTWLFGRELVNKDHTFYFSPKTLACLCGRYGLLPTRLLYTVQPPTKYDSASFVFLRRLLLTRVRSMSPSIIMHFQPQSAIDEATHFEYA